MKEIFILLIIVQIFQIIYSSYIMFLKKKKNMLLHMFIGNAISLTIFAIADLKSAFLTTIFITVRSFLFMFRDKYKTNLIFYFCLFLHLLPGIITYDGLISLLPSITAIIAIFVIWFGNEQQIRLGLIIPNFIWVIYYCVFEIYISAAFNIIVIIFEIISFITSSTWYKNLKRVS